MGEVFRLPTDDDVVDPVSGVSLTTPNASPSGPVDVIVVGAGITGCATAYHLARAGARVHVIDRHEVGTEASGRNAGSLHGQIQHQTFVELGEGWARDYRPVLEFLLESLKLWQGLCDELGVDLEVVTHGGLLLVDDVHQMHLVERKVAIEREIGLDSRVLTRDEVRVVAPYVADSVIGAGFSPVEGRANPMLSAPAFARAAAHHGVTFKNRVTVRAIDVRPDEVIVICDSGTMHAAQVVLASGDGLAAHAASLGVHLAVSTEPVQVSATEPVVPLIDHLLYFAGRRLTLKQARTGTLLIGGGWPARLEPGTGYPLVDIDSLRQNLAVAVRAAPVLSRALVVRTWAGIGNGTPDHHPIVGTLAGTGRVHVGLFPHMGFTAGPLMGRVLADLALGLSPLMDITTFDPARFTKA